VLNVSWEQGAALAGLGSFSIGMSLLEKRSLRLHPDIFWDFLHRHWVSAFFLLLTLGTILVLFTIRSWFRHRWRRLLKEQLDDENELDFLPPRGLEDRKASDLIRQLRRDVWETPESELRLGAEFLTQRALGIIQSLASIYHPEIEAPEYEASLIQSLQLIRRVATRLSRLATIAPFRFLGNRKLSDYQRYYHVYLKINEHPVLLALKQHKHLYRIARWALHARNLGNPLYWAGKELSREGYFFMLRWFYVAFIGQVGREAMRLYSGRHFQEEEDRDAAVVCYRLFALTRMWGGPSRREWALLLDYVTKQPNLESEMKVRILSKFSQDKVPRDLEGQSLQTPVGIKWYREGLKHLLEDDTLHSSQKRHHIEKELEALK
jgi:hypothetical protein